MTLLIQTNIPGWLAVWVFDGQGPVQAAAKSKIQFHGSDRLLALVDRTIRAAGVKWPSIRSITVVRGPGPFTAVRTGIIVANTLGMLWGIPVSGIIRSGLLTSGELSQLPQPKKRSVKFVRPSYGREPNITKPKTQA